MTHFCTSSCTQCSSWSLWLLLHFYITKWNKARPAFCLKRSCSILAWLHPCSTVLWHPGPNTMSRWIWSTIIIFVDFFPLRSSDIRYRQSISFYNIRVPVGAWQDVQEWEAWWARSGVVLCVPPGHVMSLWMPAMAPNHAQKYAVFQILWRLSSIMLVFFVALFSLTV